MGRVTKEDVDALVGPATPQFALQLRARVRELIADLPEGDAVRRYGEEQMAMLNALAYASTTSRDSPPESRSRIGWETIPSAAPVRETLPNDR